MIQIMAALLLAFNVQASPEADAIKAQAGCYKVDFKFEETFKADPNYPISSDPYHEWGTEWIEVDYDAAGEVHLQHILITPHGPLKHWRQEWALNATEALTFKGDNHWETQTLKLSGNNDWLQKVYQVDDSPRYECAAPWAISSEEASWICKTWSPLPRREFSKRNDYNILDRGNIVQVHSQGWNHFQANDKVIYANGVASLIAKEEGVNTYTKIDDSECASAKTWWSDNKAVWHDIQATWKHIYSEHPVLKLKAKVDEKVLWMHLFELADSYALKTYDPKILQKEAHDIIHKFIIE